MNTTDKNTLIAEFMKWDILNDMTYSEATKGKWIELDKLKFHSNWNWLMEVVKECYSKEHNQNSYYEAIYYSLADLNIEAIYNAVVAFIEWYNSAGKK